MKKHLLWIVALLAAVAPTGAQTLSLQECRQMARDNNKSLQMASAEKKAAYWQRKSAFTNYLPKISASGGYMFTSRELSLLSDDQKNSLTHMGDVVAGATAGQLPPQLPLGEMLRQPLNAAGAGVVDALTTDTRNTGAVALMLTQPIYMGGKIRAYNKIAALAEEAAADKYDIALQDLMVEVDETYWQIVALTAKRELAESYLKVVTDLNSDVEAMIAAGLATKADGLSVAVKVNEANVSLVQVTNGVSLLKMLMCQLIGLDENSDITLADESMSENQAEEVAEYPADNGEWLTNRPELRALGVAEAVERQKVNLALSETMPTVALTGGYLWTSPSVFNGFENRMRGMWNVGVMVNIPIITWGDRIYKVKAAKARSRVARLNLEETTEKVRLQIAQSRQKVDEARQRLTACRKNVEVAEENLRVATLGLREGVIPVINVNQAQTAWVSARSELIASQIDLKLANIHLRRALGLTI